MGGSEGFKQEEDRGNGGRIEIPGQVTGSVPVGAWYLENAPNSAGKKWWLATILRKIQHPGLIEDSMTQWRNEEPKIWHWRICAQSSDGQRVTLGKYDTENEARAEYDRIIKDKSYCNVSLESLTTADPPAA